MRGASRGMGKASISRGFGHATAVFAPRLLVRMHQAPRAHRSIAVGHGPFIDAVRAGNACTSWQAQNHRVHYILRPLPNQSYSILARRLGKGAHCQTGVRADSLWRAVLNIHLVIPDYGLMGTRRLVSPNATIGVQKPPRNDQNLAISLTDACFAHPTGLTWAPLMGEGLG